MKRCCAAMVAAMLLLAADGRGAVIVESFEDYNVGDPLHGLDGGGGWLGPWDIGTEARRPEVTTVDGGLDYYRGEILIDGGDRALQYAFTEGEIDVISTRPIPPQPGTFYMSLLYRDTVDNDPVGTGDDFLQFGLLNGPDNPTVSAINRDGEFQVRHGTPADNSMGTSVQPEVGKTYLLVLKAEKTGGGTYDKLTLFVDPTSLSEAANPSVTVDGNSGLDLSSDAFFVIRKAFHEPGDTTVVDRFRIAETFVDAVASLPAQTLIWDDAGDGEWSDLDGSGYSRWRDPATPNTPVPHVPGAMVHAVLDADNKATVEVGTPGSPVVRQALSLLVQRGAIAIGDGSTLNVTDTADFAVGAMLELRDGATLTAGGGRIDHVTTIGNTTLNVHSGTLTVDRIDYGGNPATLDKQGQGTLLLDNTAGGSRLDAARIDVTAGTLSAVGANPLADAAQVTLFEGTTLRLQNVPIVTQGTGLTEAWFDGATFGMNPNIVAIELDPLLGTAESIDVNPGLLARLPGEGQNPLDRALSYDTNEMNARSQGVTGQDFFAALWHGTMTVAPSGSGAPIEAGELTLGTASDDGSAFWIDVDSDPGTADWQMIVDNRGLHPEQSRVGSVTLAAGTYDVAIPFYEKDGEDAIEVRFRQGAFAGTHDEVWGQLTHVVYPSDESQFGIWGGADIDLIELPALDLHEKVAISVRGPSTLDVATDHNARLGRLEMQEGMLTTTGAREGISFATSSVLMAGAAVGIDAEVPTTLNGLDGSPQRVVTFTKTGPADLILTGENGGLDQTTFDVRQGRLVAVSSHGPMGRATVRLDGGQVVLAGEHGKPAADYSGNAIVLHADGSLVAGSGGVGSTDPVAVTLGSPGTRNVQLGPNTLTLQTTDGYTLNVAGHVTGSGEVAVAEGTVAMTGAVDVARLTVTGGSLTLDGHDVVVRDSLQLGRIRYSLTGASHFSVSEAPGGPSLASAATLTLDGGVLDVAGPPAVLVGAVAFYTFDDGTAQDSSPDGNDNTGTLVGVAPVTDPQRGVVMGFGRLDYVEIADNDDFNVGSGDMTWAAWVKADANIDAYSAIVAKDSFQEYVVRYVEGNNLAFYRGGGNSGATAPAPPLDAWFHLAYTHQAGTGTLYVNGVASPGADVGDLPHDPAKNLLLGYDPVKGYGFSGLMDDVGVWNTALDPAAVAALYQTDIASTIMQTGSTDLVIAGDAAVTATTNAMAVAMRDLTVVDGVGTATFRDTKYMFQDASIADGVTVDGRWEVGGTLDVGSGLGSGVAKMTVGDGELVLSETATYRAEVSLAGLDAEADVIEVSGAGALRLGGTLAVVGTGRTSNGFWDNVSQTIVTNTSGGAIGDVASGTGYTFDDVVPAPGTTALAHVGQGVFLRDVHSLPAPDAGPSTTGVELELFLALGGDADGDGKVWLSDWAALRANFGNSGTGKKWTDGNTDPWIDDKVWLSDWAALRAGFGNSGYTSAEAQPNPVPEPGTLAMLLAGFIGLVAMPRKRGHH